MFFHLPGDTNHIISPGVDRLRFRYVCRCCGMTIADIHHSMVTEGSLGLDSLTPEERQHIISREPSGDTVVRVLCDYCTEALEQNPELALIGTPLQ
jgi:hypothetical protein